LTVKLTPFTLIEPFLAIYFTKDCGEKALRLNQGIDGQLVSGRVDGQGKVVDKSPEGKSVRFKINVPQSLVKYIARKGSITVNGVSLTVNSIEENEFDINIVPH
jgi:riboflavin synthase